MICLIVTETALFMIFVVAYLFYIGKSLSGPYPSGVLETPVIATICLLSSSLTIVLAEREREYVLAARAAGASPARVLVHHLLPAASGYVLTQASLLLPAFILAEATMSYVGLGFQGDVATWGTMLADASNVALLGDAPWTLAPAVPIFLVALGVNIAARPKLPAAPG